MRPSLSSSEPTIMFLIYFIFLGLSSGNPLSPDSKKIYSDISGGRGLYSNFDKLTNLNAFNFKETVFNNSNGNAWLIEFYNSWCGHCHRFSPVWKQFAIDIYDWRDVVSVGTVDCSNALNTPLCREMEVMYYPLVKYFPPSPSSDYLGFPIKVGDIDHLVNSTVKLLRQDSLQALANLSTSLLPSSGPVSDFWSLLPDNVLYLLVVAQKNEMFLGEALVLDFLKIPKLRVKIVLDNNTEAVGSLKPLRYPSVFVVDRNNNINHVASQSDSRFNVYESVRTLLTEKGLDIPKLQRETVPTDFVVDISQVMAMMDVEDKIKKKLNLNSLSDVVFQVDLESAVKQSLKIEIPRRKRIEGEVFQALDGYLKTLIEFFPFSKNGIKYLNFIHDQIKDKTEIGGSEFLSIVQKSEDTYKPFLSEGSGWLGCRGSQPRFRGYPCGLWTLFHTLTVHAEHARAPDGRTVLRTILGYVKNFFGCSDCSEHFQEMAITIEGNVTSSEDAVLWLWKAHNSVNHRLKSDQTEDPKHPKVEFPPRDACQACRYANGSWNQQVVLPFLRKMYLDISYLVVDELPSATTQSQPISSKILKHQQIVEEKTYNYSQIESKPILFNFNIFDVSLFVMLYLFSMAIIVLVCIKFLFKKNYRKKTYLYDIFQKV